MPSYRHPEPETLNPKPYVLNPTPYILSPKPLRENAGEACGTLRDADAEEFATRVSSAAVLPNPPP